MSKNKGEIEESSKEEIETKRCQIYAVWIQIKKKRK